METTRSPQTISGAEPAPAEAGKFESIAEDRLEGAEQIGRFIGNLTPRETRRLLEGGHWPCWREGRIYVASKAALRAHWRAMTAQLNPGQPQPVHKIKSARRGYHSSPSTRRHYAAGA
jgi:hypothetical protein